MRLSPVARKFHSQFFGVFAAFRCFLRLFLREHRVPLGTPWSATGFPRSKLPATPLTGAVLHPLLPRANEDSARRGPGQSPSAGDTFELRKEPRRGCSTAWSATGVVLCLQFLVSESALPYENQGKIKKSFITMHTNK